MLRFLHRLAVLRFIGIFPPMGVTDKKAKTIRGLLFYKEICSQLRGIATIQPELCSLSLKQLLFLISPLLTKKVSIVRCEQIRLLKFK